MKKPRIITVIALASIAAFGVLGPRFATPARADGGTLTLTNTSVSYTQGPFVVPNESDSAVAPVCGPQLCGLYSLTLDVPAGTEAT